MGLTYELTACPACGCDRADLLAGRDDILAEIDALWRYHTRNGKTSPALDELRDRVAFTHPPPLALVRCPECGLLYRNPRERSVDRLYAGESSSRNELERLLALQQGAFDLPVRRLTRLLGRPCRVLEVGSYVGAFLAAARAAGWHATGLDVNADAVDFARSHGHDVRVGGIEDASGESEYDVVAFWNCFDQLPDPATALAGARTRLRRGGVLALRVPNGGFYAALRPWLRLPLVSALLARHNLLGFPYRHGFTRAALARLIGRYGFTTIALHGAGALPSSQTTTRDHALRLIERALQPLSGPPWLELYARRD